MLRRRVIQLKFHVQIRRAALSKRRNKFDIDAGRERSRVMCP